MNVYDAIATAGWMLLVLGWWFRRDRARHLRFVIPGMAVDLGLVLWLEFTRSVIELTVSRSYSLAEQIHIGTSAAAVVLYIPTIWLGIGLIRRTAGASARAWHKRCAVTALVLRTIGWGFMWTVQQSAG